MFVFSTVGSDEIEIDFIVGGVWSRKEGWVRGSSLCRRYSACSVCCSPVLEDTH